jgi:putative membrane protein
MHPEGSRFLAAAPSPVPHCPSPVAGFSRRIVRMLRIALAALHLVALGLGLGAVIARGTALRESPSNAALRRAFRSDTTWGIAALLWIVTGVWRLVTGIEKPTAYYLANPMFHAKMGLFLLILVLEAWPMFTLMRWRRNFKAGESAERLMTRGAGRRISTISHFEALLVVAMVFVAVAMARGFGSGRG